MDLYLALSCWIAVVATYLIGSSNCTARLSYKELEKMGASCSPKDTCSVPRDAELDVMLDYRCQCNASCVKSKTCCIDSPHVRLMNQYWKRDFRTCQRPYSTWSSILMVSQCHPSWRGDPLIKSLCGNPTDHLKDPIGQAPVTNMRSETTYSNYFCALCNNDADSLKFWTMELTKVESYLDRNEGRRGNVNKDDILRRLVLKEKVGWVVTTKDERNNVVTEPVDIRYLVPAGVDRILSHCMDGLVSECKTGWRDENVREMCHSYMGIVYLYSNETLSYGMQKPYRNIYCAICNDVDFSPGKTCNVQLGGFGGGYKPPLSFTLLLDVNLSDGDKVGEINRCGRGKMYDQFFNKCRDLVCGLPGYVIKDDKCVPP